MRYPLQPTPLQPTRPLTKVVAGNGSDARWRDVPAGVTRIDSTRRHELAKTARKS